MTTFLEVEQVNKRVVTLVELSWTYFVICCFPFCDA